MEKIVIASTKHKQVIDITDQVNRHLSRHKAASGLCYLFVTHTTAALTVADLDPGTDQDLLDAFEIMVPKLKYRHPHDPTHVGDHILSALIGSFLTLPYESGDLQLGTWQSVVLVELNGPRERTILIKIISG